MSHRRPYYVFDANFEFRGMEWLDLTDPLANARVIFDGDVSAVGIQGKINFGRDVDAEQRAAVDAGVFPKGEHPKRQVA